MNPTAPKGKKCLFLLLEFFSQVIYIALPIPLLILLLLHARFGV